MSAVASHTNWGHRRCVSHLAEIADELAELVQLLGTEISVNEANGARQEIAPRHLAEMEAVIDAAFAYPRERGDADFFTLPTWAPARYAANWQ